MAFTDKEKLFLKELKNNGWEAKEAIAELRKAQFKSRSPLTASVSGQIGKAMPGAIEIDEKFKSLPAHQQKLVEQVAPTIKASRGELIDAYAEKNRKASEGELAAVAAENIESGVRDVKKGVGELGEAVTGETTEGVDISASDRGLKLGQGLIDVAGGTAGALFGGPSAVISEVPVVGPAVEEGFGFIDEKSREAAIIAAEKLGIDPDSEQGLALQKGFSVGSQLGLVKAAPKVIKPVSERVKPVLGKATTAAIDKIKTTFEKLPINDAKLRALTGTTGLKFDTVKIIAENPEVFTKVQQGTLGREIIANSVEQGINKKIADLRGAGSEFKAIRENPTKIQVPQSEIIESLGKRGLSVKDGKVAESGVLSTNLTATDIAAINKAYDLVKGAETLNANQVLNLRQRLDKLVDFRSEVSKPGQSVVMEMRKAVDTAAKNKVQGLKELDAKFSQKAQDLKSIKKEFFTKDGELKPAFLNQMLNLTKEGRQNKLALLEEVRPGITAELLAVKAFEDVSQLGAGKFGLPATGVVTGYALGGPVGAYIGILASNPNVAIPLIKKFGKGKASKKALTEIQRKVEVQEPLSKAESGVFLKIIQEARPETIPFIDRETTKKEELEPAE